MNTGSDFSRLLDDFTSFVETYPFVKIKEDRTLETKI